MTDTTKTVLVPPMLDGSTDWTETTASPLLVTKCPTVTWIMAKCANCREWYETSNNDLFCPACIDLYQ